MNIEIIGYDNWKETEPLDKEEPMHYCIQCDSLNQNQGLCNTCKTEADEEAENQEAVEEKPRVVGMEIAIAGASQLAMSLFR